MTPSTQKWLNPPRCWPAHGQEVWVRTHLNFAAAPIRCRFDQETLTFAPVSVPKTATAAASIPWYVVAVFRGASSHHPTAGERGRTQPGAEDSGLEIAPGRPPG